MMQMREGMIPSITAAEIEEMVAELAREIERDYEGKELVLICPLKGSVLFLADLCRKIKLPQQIDFVYITSPKGESCRILKDVSVDLQGKHVLIIEEIIDAGRTLSFLKARLMASYPASLKVVALLDKPALRTVPVTPDYVGRTIEDRFVIGYGMDSEEIGRNYPDIYNFAQ
ncbi:MAG: hypoxanthine phosphoribosyltransferase [Calothrix sp. SM1_5_4]|nr:hypoxanthine phosphoribosyltransferase [Calothrix sp. SM1_5_4]